MKILYGKKTILFPMMDHEWDYFTEVYGQEDYRKLYGLVDEEGVEKAKQALKAKSEDGTGLFWVVRSNQGKKSRNVGIIFVLDYGDHRCNVNGAMDRKFKRGLGIRLKDKEYREKHGVTFTEDAFKVVIDYCFNEIGKDRIESTIEEDNKLAINLTKKVGFKKEGVLRDFAKNGNGYLNVVMLSIVREDR